MESGKFVNENENTQLPDKKDSGITKSILGYLHDLVYLLAAILILFLICFRVVVVSGPSMQNTLIDGDYLLLIGKPFYTQPAYGDVIVAAKDSYGNGTPIVKRIIATEGQLVDIDFETGVVTVDGEALSEPYIKNLTTLFEGTRFPLRVEPGCVFVMGDNRMNSKDSRDPIIGQIDTREILGKAIVLFLPGTDGGKTDRDYSRIGALS
jgi:signal peptidase I